ncbi:thioredoxin-related transmembrane protein 2 homolog [Copidosoma floridanum]|uniref:thioredoxin-related transmembrane protein 2 homolog n=1 Tax=Copidosoma floridanum TaxID=29053 RepID=UPI0006C9A6D6|nr:thioredoxin-related transmembrane protein 2 homolog [Copidosoma floridanum]XP_014206898.1 thioredoxin-related transmembrane protein 2 homolog [Copidosoma floridanum]
MMELRQHIRWLKRDLRQLMRPYYLINILLSLSYVIAKRLPYICNFLFGQSDCELNDRESETLFFLMIVVMIRARKTQSVNMISYFSSSFVYCKVAMMILWFQADIHLGILYGLVFLLCGLLLPEPTYQGPENVTYLRGASSLQEELQRDTRVVWLVAFYTAWNPACVNFAPTFSELSAKYALENFRFGKMDIGRYPDVAAKYNINDSSKSLQLPTLILFKDGKEYERRPYADGNGKLVKFLFSQDNTTEAFNLKSLYETCSKNPIKKKDKKPIKSD